MTSAGLIKFLAVVMAVALGAHFVTATAATWAIRTWYSHRIFNVRAWSNEGAGRFHLVGTFLTETTRDKSRPVIAFAGSSVSYGYPWNERFIYSRLFAERRPAIRVINPSIVAADITGINDWIICGAWRNALHLNAIVVELPVVNTTAYLAGRHGAGQQLAPIGSCDPGPNDPGYFRVAVTNRRGLGWLSFLWDRESEATAESQLQIAKVPRGYFTSAEDFAAIRDSFAGRVTATLRNAQRVASTVYAFPSPVFVGGLPEIGEDVRPLEEQLRAALAACRSVEGVRCIDPSAMYVQREAFYNLTHLNQAGHRAMADLLDEQIAQ